MSGRVRMVHPALPPEQAIAVRPAAVPIYQASGWQVADEPADESATAASEPGAEPPAAARRRQKTRTSTVETEE